MPLDPRTKSAKFKFGLDGMVSKEDPTLLGDGRYRACTNMEVVQEGSLSTRAGSKLFGSFTGTVCFMIRKMVVTPSVEVPSIPSTNPRYVELYTGTTYDLYRTTDYSTWGAARVAAAINSSLDAANKKPSVWQYTRPGKRVARGHSSHLKPRC